MAHGPATHVSSSHARHTVWGTHPHERQPLKLFYFVNIFGIISQKCVYLNTNLQLHVCPCRPPRRYALAQLDSTTQLARDRL